MICRKNFDQNDGYFKLMRNHKCASAFWWTLKAPFCWITSQLHVMSEVTSRAITIGAYPAESCDYVCFAPLRHYRSSPSRFSFFTTLFSWVTNKNLQHGHCSLNCSALMMMITGVIETLENKIGIDLTVPSTLKKPSKNYNFLFWDVSDYS